MAKFDFDMFKKNASKVADKSVLFAKKAADKAVEYAKVTKLNAEIVSEKDKMRKAYQEIGKIYYDLHKDAPEAEFASAIEALEAAKAAIKAKRTEIEALKATEKVDVCADIDDDDVIDVEAEIVSEDGIPETEEATLEEDIFADLETEDSIPETEEAPVSEEIAE